MEEREGGREGAREGGREGGREGRRERKELPVAFISSQYHKHRRVAMVIADHF